MNSLCIATRNSPLALWQAEFVKSKLLQHYPTIDIRLAGFKTRGDVLLDSPLAKIGGKGLFVKELEQAMLEKTADIAVHSMKDVPIEFPKGLGLPIILKREEPRDALVSNEYRSFSDLPSGAVVGTSSLRRQCQLRAQRPDVIFQDLRGNVNTRLKKLDEGEFDAIVLAAAGLIRLGMAERITEQLNTEVCLPAGGQGALGIECRVADDDIAELLAPLHDRSTAICVRAERALNRHLQGGCQVPIACFAELENTPAGQRVAMRALVGSLDGNRLLHANGVAKPENSTQLGIELAEDLLAQGADRILAEVYDGK